MDIPSGDPQRVIEHRGKPLVVVAGPGTGKTTALIERTRSLFQENRDANVAFITFTRTSRRDIHDHLVKEFGELPEMNISTVHTFAKAIVHKNARLVGLKPNFHVFVEIEGVRECALIIKEALMDAGINVDVQLIKAVREMIAKARNTNYLYVPDGLTEEKAREVLKNYFILSDFYNAIDIEALVSLAKKVILQNPYILSPLYLHVDEYQDLNPADQGLVKAIADDTRHQVVVVGDDAQSIYGFRDANFKGIKEIFESDEWEGVSFTDCHRLPCHILRASQLLLRKNSSNDYLGSRTKLQPDDRRKVPVFEFTSAKIEVEGLVTLIQHLLKSGKKEDGSQIEYKDIMVLCPTGDLVNILKKDLESKEIPVKVRKRCEFPKDNWRLLLLLRLVNDNDSLALRQWLQIIKINQKTIQTWREEAMMFGASLFDYLWSLKPSELSEFFIRLVELRDAKSESREFLHHLRSFPYLLPPEELFPAMGLTLDQLGEEAVSVEELIKNIYGEFGILDQECDFSDEDKVLMTTMHSSKGLEAPIVIVARLNHQYMPMANRDEQEELRVLYVAMTRAKQQLYLSFYEYYDQEKQRRLNIEALSPFLRNINGCLKVSRVNAEKVRRLAAKLK